MGILSRILSTAGAFAILGLVGLFSTEASASVTLESDLTLDGCSGGCATAGVSPFGTITITQASVGADVVFDIDLGSAYSFQNVGNGHNAFMFNPNFSFSYVTPLQSDFTALTSSSKNNPYGTFQQGLDYSGTSGLKTLDFSLSVAPTFDLGTLGTGSFLESTAPPNGWTPAYFSADIFSTNGKTGDVAADHITLVNPVNPVPEPSTWVMMILGFAGLGVFAYRRQSRSMVTV